ncbi:MAG: hypothetical protein HOP33_08950 [Verrucomicrobia bacterium]|nr:hypothetical protein [Verrucomicrobiota bacterium]
MPTNYTVVAKLDAENKRILLVVVDDSGTVDTAWGTVVLALGKDPGTTPLDPGTTMGMDIQLRETKGCDDAGTPQYCMIPRSTWYPTAKTSDPTI